MIVVNNLSAQPIAGGYRLSADVRSARLPHALYFDISSDSAFGCPDCSYDPFLLALVIPAMEQGEDLHVDGAVDAQLLHHINNGLIPLLHCFRREWQIVRASAAQLREAENGLPRLPGAITAVSGGVDSFATLHDYYFASGIPPHYRIAATLFNDSRSHDKDRFKPVFAQRTARAREFSRQLGLPLFTTRTNLSAFYRSKFTLNHTLKNAAIAHFFSHRVSSFIYSSSVEFRNVAVAPKKDISYLDTLILPLASSSRMQLISGGSRHNRVDKTLLAFRLPLTRQFMDVCTKPTRPHKARHNCGYCVKCTRFLVTAEAHGLLDEYGEAFDLALYRKHYYRILLRLVGRALIYPRLNDDVTLRHLGRLGFRLPLGLNLAARLLAACRSRQD